MISWLKKYWLELVVFGVILAILMIDMAPSWTYMNKAADSIGYAYSAQYLYPAFHTSSPLFVLLGHVFMMIPVATQAWRFELLSVLATMGTCLFVYLIIRNKLNRWYALLGTLIVGLSAIVISQSIIIETYPLATMLATGAFYFVMKKKWYLTAVFLGAGLAVHLLAFFVFFIFLLGFKEYRNHWKALLITVSFGLFYIYIPLASRNAPPMWLPVSGNFVLAQIKDIWTTITGLVGQIAIYDVPKRLADTLCIVGVSLGVFALIPAVAYFWRKKFYKDPLFWLIIIPIGLFISELDMNTFDYTMLAIPFLAIVAMLGLNKMMASFKYAETCRILVALIIISVLGFGAFNANYFDIGRTLDFNMSTTEYFTQELPKIPNGSIYMPLWGWEWEAAFKYNKDNDAHLIIVNEDMLVNPLYQKQIMNDGVRLVPSLDKNQSIAAKEMAQSIIQLNDVWTTVTTDPSTFGCKVVEANHDVNLAPLPDKALIASLIAHPPWQWKPWNPYKILDTSLIESIGWQYVVISNHSLAFFVDWGGGFLLMYWFIWTYVEKSNKKKKAKKDVAA